MDKISKVLIITGSLNIGGAERAVCNLTTYMEHVGIQTVIGLVGEDPAVRMPLHPDVRVHIMPKKQHKGSLGKYSHIIGYTYKLIKETKPDIVVSFLAYVNITSCIAAMGTGIPLVVSERSDPNRDPDRTFFRILRRLVYPFAKGYIFQTEDARRFFGKGIQKRGTVIQNALPAVLPPVQRQQVKKNVVAVGRLAQVKNYPMLIAAFAQFAKQYPDYTLEFYGDGPERERLESLCRETGIEEKAVFHGNVPNVMENIQNAGMFVLCSSYEGLPNALLEAMAMELPCIATDCPIGGPKSLIKNQENGLLVPVDDAAALASAMCDLAQDPEQAAAMGKRAGQVRQNNSNETVGQAYCDYLEKTVKKYRKGR